MKYKLFKDNNKFQLLNCVKIIKYDEFEDPSGRKKTNKIISVSRGAVSTKIFTDGEIKGITELDSKNVTLPKQLSNVETDVNEVKDLELVNHNYVIRVLTVLELLHYGKERRGCGFFEVVKDVEVYWKDKKDKETLRNIRKTLNLIYRQRCDYSSIFEILLSKSNSEPNISYKKKEENVYQLVKTK